jgi:hypothetical protein
VIRYTDGQVTASSHLRRWIALLCIAALLLASAAPATLAPFWLFLEILVILEFCRGALDPAPAPTPCVARASSRAPPVR